MVSDPGRTKRAKAFRERLGSSDLNRWEIYTSESIKNQVRGIAKSEGLSSGVAAEALLRLGIEAYRATENSSSATAPASNLVGIRSAVRGVKKTSVQAPVDKMQLESSAKRDSSKPLSSYSSRTGSSLGAAAQSASASEKAAKVVRAD